MFSVMSFCSLRERGTHATTTHDVIGQSQVRALCPLQHGHLGHPTWTYSNLFTWELPPSLSKRAVCLQLKGFLVGHLYKSHRRKCTQLLKLDCRNIFSHNHSFIISNIQLPSLDSRPTVVIENVISSNNAYICCGMRVKARLTYCTDC